MFGFALQ